MYKLVIEDEDGRATEIPLIREEVTIGRKEGNTVRLPERNVSRRHARLFKANGHIWLEDAGSRYGIKVNGSRLVERIQLQVGDHIQIGDYQIALQLEGDVVDTVAPQPVPQEGEDEQDALETAETGKKEVSPGPAARPGDSPTSKGKGQPPQLMVISSNVPKDSWSIEEPEVTIGREGPLDIVIDHASMSRTHARIHHGSRFYSIVDLASANGIKVNGETVGACDLRSGDVLQLGEVKLRFVRREEQGALERAVADYHDREESRRVRQLIVGLAVALSVVVVAFLAVALSTGDEEEAAGTPPPATAAAAAPAPAPARPPPPAANEVADLIVEGRQRLEERDWKGAASTLSRALVADPLHEEAERLRNRAHVEGLHEQTFREFQAAVDRRDFEAIELKLSAIPVESVYRSEAEGVADQIRAERAAFYLARGDRARDEGLLREAKSEYEATLRVDPENLEAQRGITMVGLRLRAEGRRRAGSRGAHRGAAAAGEPPPPVAEGAVEGQPPEGAVVAPPPIEAPPPEVKEEPPAPPPKKAPAPSKKATRLDRKREAMLLYTKARKLIRSEPGTAEGMLKKAIRLYPKAAGAHRLLGNYYAEQGKPNRACKHLKRFLKLSPQHPQGPAIREQLARFGCPEK